MTFVNLYVRNPGPDRAGSAATASADATRAAPASYDAGYDSVRAAAPYLAVLMRPSATARLPLLREGLFYAPRSMRPQRRAMCPFAPETSSPARPTFDM